MRTHHRAVRTYARSMASSDALADDAVQETFLRAWRYLDSFRGSGSFEGWLIRICRRCIIDLEQRERRASAAALPAAPAVAPDYRSEIVSVMATLPPAHREVLVLCGVLGYDYDDAARVLDIPVGTVRSRLHRARTALAERLEPDRAAQEPAAS